jgi:hypothetical protein
VRTPAFKRFARIFAVILLAWTAAHLVHHGLCAHDREHMGRFVEFALRSPSSTPDAPLDGHDDSFCCSHVVDVGRLFQFSAPHDATRVVEAAATIAPDLNSAPLYHPPLG